MFTHFSELFALSAGRQSAHNNPPSRITEIRQSLNGFYTPLTATRLQKPNFFKAFLKFLKLLRAPAKGSGKKKKNWQQFG